MLLNKQNLTVWVPAHLIGQVSKAPFIPELLWQAGALKHSPLQPCESTHTAPLIFELAQRASHLVNAI